MRTNTRGFIAKVLVLCLVVGLLPTLALASDPDHTITALNGSGSGRVEISYAVGSDVVSNYALTANDPYTVRGSDTEVTIRLVPGSGYTVSNSSYYMIGNDTHRSFTAGTDGTATATVTMRADVTVWAAFDYVGGGSGGSGSGGSGSGSTGSGTTEEPTVSFTDIPTDAYYADAVAWAVKLGITEGTTDTTFSPEEACSRAQMVTFLWRAAGKPNPDITENPFTDVDVNDYYGKAVLWAVEMGITTGTSDTTFSPDAECTRAQAVTFLYRYEKEPNASASDFSDVPADAYYEAAVNWAAATEVTNGTTNTTFSPEETCTRGQVVTFLYRDMGD